MGIPAKASAPRDVRLPHHAELIADLGIALQALATGRRFAVPHGRDGRH